MNIIPLYNKIYFEKYKHIIDPKLLDNNSCDIIVGVEDNGKMIGYVVGIYNKIYQNKKYVELIIQLNKNYRGRILVKNNSILLKAFNILKTHKFENINLKDHVGVLGKITNPKISKKIINRLSFNYIFIGPVPYCEKEF